MKINYIFIFCISFFSLLLNTANAGKFEDMVRTSEASGDFEPLRPYLDEPDDAKKAISFTAEKGHVAAFSFFMREVQNKQEMLRLLVKEKKINIIDDYYVFRSKLGKGAFATVWKGMHIPSQRPVAVKIVDLRELSSKSLANLEQEIRITLRLQHPNIVQLEYYKMGGKHAYLFMEYCGDGTLSDRLKNDSRFDEQTVKSMMRQLVDGLVYLRANSLVHRDLKPQNLLLQGDVLKIADFGFAKDCEEDQMMQTICGTPFYMAPEILDMKKYDNTADLWSSGIIMYQMATGTLPYQARTPLELRAAIARQVIVRPAGLSDNCWDLITKLLVKNPSDRLSFEALRDHPFFREDPITPDSSIIDVEIDTSQSSIGSDTLAGDSGSDMVEDYYSAELMPEEKREHRTYVEPSYNETQQLVRQMHVLFEYFQVLVNKEDFPSASAVLADFTRIWSQAREQPDQSKEEADYIAYLGRLCAFYIERLPPLPANIKISLVGILQQAVNDWAKEGVVLEFFGEKPEVALSLYRRCQLILNRLATIVSSERDRRIVLGLQAQVRNRIRIQSLSIPPAPEVL